MSGTLSPSGLKWNDPGEEDWEDDENDNITLLNGTLLKAESMLDVDDTEFATNKPEMLIREDGAGEFETVYAPYASEFMTTTTSTTSTTTTT